MGHRFDFLNRPNHTRLNQHLNVTLINVYRLALLSSLSFIKISCVVIALVIRTPSAT
jgi:hypothetical protein